MVSKVYKEVTSPQEYKEAIEAAQTLGLDVYEVHAYGYGWKAKDGNVVNPGGASSKVEIVDVGRKYFYMSLRGENGTETVGVECGEAYDELDDSRLVIEFR